jgi:hypothetical protein
VAAAAEKLQSYTWGESFPAGYKPTDAEKRTIGEITEKFVARIGYKQKYEQTWFTVHAYLLDLPYMTPAPQFAVPYRIPSAGNRAPVRMVISLAQAYAQRTVARLTSAKPEIAVAPATASQEDIDRAEVAEMVIQHLWEAKRVQKVLRDATGWMVETGNGIIRFDWNPNAGPSTEDGVPIGDIELCALSPYEVDFDPEGRDLESCQWVMFNRVRPVQWIKDNYPDKADLIVPEETYVHTLYAERLRNLVGVFGSTTSWGAGTNYGMSAGKCATMIEYWERPSKQHPKGRRVIMASKIILHDGPNPYDHGDFPIVMFREVPVAGRILGRPRLESGLPLIQDMNRLRSQMVQIRNRMCKPKWIVPITAKVAQSSITDESGEVVTYYPSMNGEKPMPMPSPEMPSTYIQQHNITMQNFEDVMGWHEVSRGQMVKGARSGRIISLLQDADDSQLAVTSEEIQGALGQLARRMLSLFHQFASEERLVKISGPLGGIVAKKVLGKDLEGKDPNADYYDVRVAVGPSLPRNRAARLNEITELLDGKVLDPVKDALAIRKALMDLGYKEQAVVDEKREELWAREENERIYKGKEVGVLKVETDDIHMVVHKCEMNSERFRKASKKVQREFMKHYEEHQANKQAKAVEDARRMAELQAAAQPPMPGPEEALTEQGAVPPATPPLPVPITEAEEGTPIPSVAPMMPDLEQIEAAAAQREQAAEAGSSDLTGM